MDKLTFILKSYGFYFWPVLIVLLILIALVQIDLPKIEQIKAARQELTGIQEKLAKLTAKTDILEALDKNKIKSDYERTSLVLPDDKDAPSILRNIETSASSSGVTIDDLDLNPGKLATTSSKINEKSNEVAVKLTISGTAAQMSDFLKKMASVGRGTGVKSFDLTFAKEGSASAKTRLEVEAYFLLPEAVLAKVGKVDEPLPSLGKEQNAILGQILKRELLIPSSLTSPAGKPDIFK